MNYHFKYKEKNIMQSYYKVINDAKPNIITNIDSRLSYPHPHLNSPSQYTPRASRTTAKTAVRDFINICQGKINFILFNTNERN
jgi:hypothetical protein